MQLPGLLYLAGRGGDELGFVVDPAVWTWHRPVPLSEVQHLRAVVDPAGEEGAVVLKGNPENLGVGCRPHHLTAAALGGDRGAVVRRCRRDEVVQEEVKGKDDAGQAKDAQRETLEPGEAANIVQDVLEPHGAETRGGDGRPQPAISGRIIRSPAAGPGGGLRGRRWGKSSKITECVCICCEGVKDFIADSPRTFHQSRQFSKE